MLFRQPLAARHRAGVRICGVRVPRRATNRRRPVSGVEWHADRQVQRLRPAVLVAAAQQPRGVGWHRVGLPKRLPPAGLRKNRPPRRWASELQDELGLDRSAALLFLPWRPSQKTTLRACLSRPDSGDPGIPARRVPGRRRAALPAVRLILIADTGAPLPA